MIKYFATYNDAKTYCHNAGMGTPAKIRVWIGYAWDQVWSVTVDN